MGSNKRKYLHNSSVRLLISCSIVSYGALNEFIGYYSKRDRDSNIKNKIEKTTP